MSGACTVPSDASNQENLSDELWALFFGGFDGGLEGDSASDLDLDLTVVTSSYSAVVLVARFVNIVLRANGVVGCWFDGVTLPGCGAGVGSILVSFDLLVETASSSSCSPYLEDLIIWLVV